MAGHTKIQVPGASCPFQSQLNLEKPAFNISAEDSNTVPAGISKPGSVSAKEATGRIPLTALSKQDGEYQKVRPQKLREAANIPS